MVGIIQYKCRISFEGKFVGRQPKSDTDSMIQKGFRGGDEVRRCR